MSSPRNTAGHALVKGWKWLDAFAKVFEAIVGGFYRIPGTGPIKTLLHGTWPLGHPLHPAITDITVGAYTAAVAIDAYVVWGGRPALEPAADFTLVVAFASSLIAIASGLTDWQHTSGEEKRTGMLHALVMVLATLAFLASILLRAAVVPGDRPAALWLSGIAWAVMLVGAFLGGELPFGYGTEVNRQAFKTHSTKWERVDVSVGALEDRRPVVARTKAGTEVFVVKIDERIHAIGNTCTHAGGPLNEGTWVGGDRCEIACPWHGSIFCVKDGSVKGGPATFPEPVFETREPEGGGLEVRAR